jgi:hypothetical protein
MEDEIQEQRFEKIRVLVETAEKTFRGYIHKPVRDPNYRLSDFLNDHETTFVNLTEVKINERAMQHRPGDDQLYVAIAVSSIVYITPLEPDAPVS